MQRFLNNEGDFDFGNLITMTLQSLQLGIDIVSESIG